MKIRFIRNQKFQLICIPFFILNLWFFSILFTLSKIPFSSLTLSLRIDSVGSHVYFVHGYNGNDSQFYDLIDYLEVTDFFNQDPDRNIKSLFFNYYEKYYNLGMTKAEIHNIDGGISTYAEDFYNQLCQIHENAEINIVAHSLGGLIVREMLRNHRYDLELLGITVLRVITLGTPHFGTAVVDHPLKNNLLI